MVETKTHLIKLVTVTILISLLSAGLAASVNASAMRSKTSSSTTCSDVVMIGVRGSGGAQTGDKGDNYTGVSAQVYGVYKKLETKLHKEKKTIKLQAVQYPATSLQTGVSNPTLFTNSIEKGKENLLQQAKELEKTCPKTKIILAGFSQGAMVVHEASMEVPSNVAGLLLIANGYRSKNDKTIFKGTGLAKNQGLAHGLIPTPKPLNGKPKSITVCVEKDIVCDQTGSISIESGEIHSMGYLNSKIQNQQANTLIKILKKFTTN
jgi:cutinase